MNTQAAKRNPVYDVAKFMVMLLVVAGHITGNDIVSHESGISYLGNMNVGLAMPLFFIVSGYFATSSATRSWGNVLARIISYFWPLASFGSIFGLSMLMVGKFEWWKALIYPAVRVYGGSWFLSTLAIIYGVCALVLRIISPVRYQLLVLFSFYIALFFTAGQNAISEALRLSSVLDMLPYYVFGMYFLRRYSLHKKMKVALPCGLVFLMVIFLEGDVRTNGMGFYWVPKDWQTVVSNRHLLFCFFGRTIVGITGSVFLLCLIGMIARFVPKFSSLAVFGTTTLGVYVMHEWPLIQVHKYCSFEPLNEGWKWPLTFGLFLICHYITISIRDNARLKIFFFGDPKWLASKINKWLTRKD